MQRTCHKTIVIHPHTGQFVINELPTLVLCGTVWVYGGMEGLPLTAIATVIALILSLLLLYRYLYLRRIRYCIGTEQLVSEYGIIRRKVDYMELYRIVDFQEHQSLLQQFCGLKTVRILSMDRNTPRLDLIGIFHRDDLVSIIRERVETNKRKKGMGFKPQETSPTLSDKPTYQEAAELAHRLMDMYVAGEVDRVEIIYHHFKSMGVQILLRETYLPIDMTNVVSEEDSMNKEEVEEAEIANVISSNRTRRN